MDNAPNIENTGAVCTPIYQSATFWHPGVGVSSGYDYSRLQNPTREELEKTVAFIEHGIDAVAFSTGMAAITAFMELFAPGDEIISTSDLYGGTVRLFDSLGVKNGIKTVYIDTNDLDALTAEITPHTKAIFIETPSNPMMHVTDIRAVVDLVAGKGIIVAVDNTFLTPYFCNPLLHGADVVIHSGTKYLGGHNDTLAGFLVTNSRKISDDIRFIYKTTGPSLSPFDSFLIMRGIKTLAVRMERSQENAVKIAEWMTKQKDITKVYYTGLLDHPGREISLRQSSGFGAMISFETASEDIALKILKNVSLILFAESLGGVESLITYPLLQTHADVPVEKREALGINARLLRLSVGIENAEDLIEDLRKAIYNA
jgi:cystathionine gamma-synthase